MFEMNRRYEGKSENPDRDRGVLLSSGFIGGEGLIAVGLAAWTYFVAKPEGIGDAWAGGFSGWVSLLLFVGLGWVLWKRR